MICAICEICVLLFDAGMMRGLPFDTEMMRERPDAAMMLRPSGQRDGSRQLLGAQHVSRIDT